MSQANTLVSSRHERKKSGRKAPVRKACQGATSSAKRHAIRSITPPLYLENTSSERIDFDLD